MRSVLFLLVFLLAFEAEAGELRIGSVAISLGQDQASATSALQAEYDLSSLDPSDLVLVVDKQQPNPRILGGVMFVKGRVVLIQKTWGEFEGAVPSVELSKVVFAAVESASRTSGAPAKATTETVHAGTALVQTITFSFPGRRVQVVTTTGGPVVQEVRVAEEVFVQGK